MPLEMVGNDPLDTQVIADLILNPDDLRLVWPAARYPFDHDQWRKVLDPSAGNKDFIFYENGRLVGHGALRVSDRPGVYVVSFLFVLPSMRSRGLGKKMISLMEQYATAHLKAEELTLVVRTYNPGAIRCYEASGFARFQQDGTRLQMAKKMIPLRQDAGSRNGD